MKDKLRAVRLVKWSLLTLEICTSNPVICKYYFLSTLLEVENKEKRPWIGHFFKKNFADKKWQSNGREKIKRLNLTFLMEVGGENVRSSECSILWPIIGAGRPRPQPRSCRRNGLSPTLESAVMKLFKFICKV